MKALIALFFIILPMSAETFVFAESYRTIRKDRSFQTNVVWGQQDLGKKVGLFGWGQYGKSYRQAYGGLYIRPTNWLQVGAGSGAEQAEKKARFGSFLYANKSRFYTFAIYENGGSGYWYLVLTDVKVTKELSIGNHSQSFFGHGVRAEYRLKPVGRWTPSIRPAIAWKTGNGAKPNFIVGLRFTYFKGE